MHDGSTPARRRAIAFLVGATVLAGCSPSRTTSLEAPRLAAAPADPETARLTSSFRRVVLDDRVTRAHALDVTRPGSEREPAERVHDLLIRRLFARFGRHRHRDRIRRCRRRAAGDHREQCEARA